VPLRNLGALHWLRGKLDDAARAYEKSLTHMETMDALAALARLALLRRQYEQASAWNRRAMDRASNNADRAEWLARMGETELVSGQAAQAEQTARRAIEMAGDTMGGVRARLVVGVALGRQNRPDEAAQMLGEAAEWSVRHYGPDHVITACVYAEYAGVLKEAKRPAEAAQYREQALAILGRRPERHKVSVSDLLQRPAW
jgi:tetratricopeptide (TPR) repeat protein